MHKIPIALALISLAIAAPVQAQAPYIVTLVGLDSGPDRILHDAYDRTTEHLYCVTSYRTVERDTHRELVVESVRAESVVATKSSLYEISCRDSNGIALPTIHTHPGGSCQASPADIGMISRRGAAFDGIICAPGAIAYYFAENIRTLITSSK